MRGAALVAIGYGATWGIVILAAVVYQLWPR